MTSFSCRLFAGRRPVFRSLPSSLTDSQRKNVFNFQTRQFHPTRPSQFIDTSITLAHDLLQGVHTVTGLPWVTSIPLTALVVRLAVLPVQIYSTKQQQKMKTFDPLIISWSRYHMKEVMDKAILEGKALHPSIAQSMVDTKLRRSKGQIYKRCGVHPMARFLPFLQLPLWLAIMESLRRMVGMDPGILGLLRGSGENGQNASKLEIPVEQSMSTEGAFWFPDLLAPDPTHALPVILSALVFTNITWGWKISTSPGVRSKKSLTALASGILRTTLQGMALLIAPSMISSQAPAGLVFYWIFSSLSATAQTQLLRRLLASRKAPTPCEPKAVGIKSS